jgi:hypothetical protein
MSVTKTDLVDRYLYAVKFWLPTAQQEDILAELREDLLSHMEEREAALGHALDDDDIAGILRKRGSPAEVASGYLPERRLINPAVLPVYWLVLKIVLLWVLAPLFALVFLGPVLASAHPWETVLLCCNEYWRAAFMTVGMVTIGFVLLDRYQVQFQHAGRWDPRKLPRVPGSEDTGARWKHLTALVFSVVAAILWAHLLWQGAEFPFRGGMRLRLGPLWEPFYWPILGLAVADAFFDLLSFLRPGWARVRSRVRIGGNICWLAIAGVLLSAGGGGVAVGNLPAAELARTTAWFNFMIVNTVLGLAVVVIIDLINEARYLVRGARTTAAPIPSAMQH